MAQPVNHIELSTAEILRVGKPNRPLPEGALFAWDFYRLGFKPSYGSILIQGSFSEPLIDFVWQQHRTQQIISEGKAKGTPVLMGPNATLAGESLHVADADFTSASYGIWVVRKEFETQGAQVAAEVENSIYSGARLDTY